MVPANVVSGFSRTDAVASGFSRPSGPPEGGHYVVGLFDGAAPELAAISQRHRHKNAAELSALQRIDDDRHLVAGLDDVRAPAVPRHRLRTAQLNAPAIDAAALVLHVELNRGMRIGPRELDDRADERLRDRPIEHDR